MTWPTPLVVTALLLGMLVVAVAVLLARRAVARHQVAADERIERLTRRVEELSESVSDTRREAVEARDRRSEEYLITSLAQLGGSEAASRLPDRLSGGSPDQQPPQTSAVAMVERQLVHALATQHGVSTVRDRAVDVVVQTMALAHGVRRALSPDVLDRAAAESQVVRRRSRRHRRQEIRQARRLVRAAAGARTPATDDRDVA